MSGWRGKEGKGGSGKEKRDDEEGEGGARKHEVGRKRVLHRCGWRRDTFLLIPTLAHPRPRGHVTRRRKKLTNFSERRDEGTCLINSEG